MPVEKRETLEECFSRVQSMANPSGTWDLSENDYHALRSVLAECDRLRESEAREQALNEYFRDSVGECHVMISRNDSEFQIRSEWEPTDLPPRLQKVMQDNERLREELTECYRAKDAQYDRAGALEAQIQGALKLLLDNGVGQNSPNLDDAIRQILQGFVVQNDNCLFLKAELAEARKDKARIDIQEAHPGRFQWQWCLVDKRRWWFDVDTGNFHETLRASTDAGIRSK